MRFLLTHSQSDEAPELMEQLEALGLKVDRNYPPIIVDPSSGRFVLRGEGSEEALERARKELGVEIFADPAIGPH